MENALWNGKLLLASEIAEDYATEKEIRKASGRKELCCPDPDCKDKILRYCHGEIKEPYFAHLSNDECDYAIFDSQNNQVMRTIRKRIYDSFKARGYHVKPEVKILSHHYTHLLFEFDDGKKIAVEIGTQRISANRIDSLTAEYASLGIPVKWIVIGDNDCPVRENQTFFIKRYALNESKNRDLMVVNWDCSVAAQYKVDTSEYCYRGRQLTSENYPDTFTEYGTLDDLTFEDGEITFAGFHQRYDEWHKKKMSAFERLVQKKTIEDEEAEKRRKQYEEQRRKEMERYANQPSPSPATHRPYSPFGFRTDVSTPNPPKTYAERKAEILPLMEQRTQPVWDSSGKRWLRCEICGAIGTQDEFGSYGGENKATIGICNKCRKR